MKEQIDIFDDLLIEFDEMGFVPTNFPHDHDSEYYAIDWKNRLINALEGYRKQSEKYLIKENGDILPLTHHSEWISVEDRLPEKNISVLVYYHRVYKSGGSFDMAFVAKLNEERFFVPFNCSPIRDKSITHWMPLPKPPEMKGGAE